METAMEMSQDEEREEFVSGWAPTNHSPSCDMWYTVERKPTKRERLCGARGNVIVAYVPIGSWEGAQNAARGMVDRIAYALNVA